MPHASTAPRTPLLIAPLPVSALRAQDEKINLRGSVRDARGPVAGANVFVLGTLDGALTTAAGRFTFHARHSTQYLLAARHSGHRELRRLVP